MHWFAASRERPIGLSQLQAFFKHFIIQNLDERAFFLYTLFDVSDGVAKLHRKVVENLEVKLVFSVVEACNVFRDA